MFCLGKLKGAGTTVENLREIDFEAMANKFTKMIVDHTPVAYVIMDKQHNIVYANNYVLDLTGYNREDLIGMKCYDVINGGVPCKNCAVRETFKTCKRAKILKGEYNKAGQQIFNDMISVPILKEDGTFDYVMEIVISKTEEVLLRKKIERDFLKLVEMLSFVLETRDEYTGDHSNNVKTLSLLIAEELDLSELNKQQLFIAANLHDIGKVGIKDSILNKPSRLTDEEYEIIKTHPVMGANILSTIESFGDIKDIVMYHHERWDGKGYPKGLKGEEIPFLARVISIADTFDAITTTRSYRKALSPEYAREELIKNSGTQFEPMLVDLVVSMIEKGKITPDSGMSPAPPTGAFE